MAHRLLERSDLTDNDLRARIIDLLEGQPGCYLGKMSEELGEPTSTLKYHLNILRSFDVVTTAKKGRCRHYFLKKRRFNENEKRMFAAMEHPPTRRLIEIIRNEPGLTQADLVRRTGLSQSTVAWHMGRLEEVSVLTSERRGVKAYYLTPEFTEVVRDHEPWSEPAAHTPPMPAEAPRPDFVIGGLPDRPGHMDRTVAAERGPAQAAHEEDEKTPSAWRFGGFHA